MDSPKLNFGGRSAVGRGSSPKYCGSVGAPSGRGASAPSSMVSYATTKPFTVVRISKPTGLGMP